MNIVEYSRRFQPPYISIDMNLYAWVRKITKEAKVAKIVLSRDDTSFELAFGSHG